MASKFNPVHLTLTLLAGAALSATAQTAPSPTPPAASGKAPAAASTPNAPAPATQYAPPPALGTADPNGNPVGHWASESVTPQGIGLWCELRPDGTLTINMGAMVTSSVQHTADTLTLPASKAGAPPVKITYKIDGTTLHLIAPNGADTTYHRLDAAAPKPSDPLLGKWRPDPVKTPSSDPRRAAMEKANANATYVFSADGTESVRIPFNSFQGTWDTATKTYKLPGATPLKYFVNTESKLVLALPPNGQKFNSFKHDPIF